MFPYLSIPKSISLEISDFATNEIAEAPVTSEDSNYAKVEILNIRGHYALVNYNNSNITKIIPINQLRKES
jgi:hypothetical protein